MAAIEMEAVVRAFGATRAVDGVSLAVPPGAFLALLGPSGCGKTTLLRLIAGLERPDAGRIALGGRLVAGPGRFVAPEARGLGMVFQSYALWPHMTVAGNIRFGLRIQRLSRAEERARIGEALEMVGLSGMADRRPHQLSGGQRQRVALARSLAVRPGLILLDEPLANLDAHLRETMLAEFRRIHAALRTTFVFVTHDQSEALSMADRVAVFNEGRIVQVGPPEEVYEQPATRFVARFVGSANVLEPAEAQALGGPARPCSLRPEKILLLAPGAPVPEGAAVVDARVTDISYQGPVRRISARTGQGLALTAAVPATAAGVMAGADIRFAVPAGAVRAMEGEQ